ncbi:tail fiber domain-containing protein [Achromobacter marplatensis]|uniref:tail fiber domain-containing protein n=1 Tax=Achromobacter marplatensis TaxID=470868 RepID=UPI001F2533D0|nr:tail fiber domain-containing protein [Achromobacter marplatensis]
MFGFIQSGDGAVKREGQEKLRDRVSVLDFGAIGDGTYHPLSERFANLPAAQAKYPFVASLSHSIDYAAIQAALDSLEARGGVVEDKIGLKLVVAGPGLLVPDGVEFDGAGNGYWDFVFPGRTKTWEGTTIFLYGTGAKTWSRRGISSMRNAGGMREFSSSPGEYAMLSSLMNPDAVGATPATPKQFSVGIRGKNRLSNNWGISNCRVVPWIGADGMSDYSNTAYTGLAADWDIGVLMEDSEWVNLRNVQVVGYWREYGAAMLNSDYDEFGGQERNLIERSKFQGQRGLAIRSGDTRAVAAKTSSTVEILWDAESFWEPAGTFTGFPDSGFTVYSYTSLSRNGGNLVFNGVTPDPTIANINTLRAPKRSSGAAGTRLCDVHVCGLDHTNGGQAAAYGLGVSTAFEVSGYPLRGLAFDNVKIQSRERILAFFHDCQDVLMDQCQFEGPGERIASPLAGASTAPAPSGDTRNMRVLSTLGLTGPMFTPRSIFNDANQINRTGLNSGLDITSPDTNPVTISSRTLGEIIRFTDAGTVGIGTTNPAQKFQVATNNPEVMRLQRTAAGLVGMQYTNTNGSVSIRVDPSAANAGSFFSSGDNAVSCGTASFRWSTVFAGTGTINTSDGRLKEVRSAPLEAELRAWGRVRPSVFKMLDAIALKGGDARLHVGYIAQEVADAFLAEGLNAADYALWCEDEVVQSVIVKETRQRQRQQRLVQQVEQIEVENGVPVLTVVDQETTVGVFDHMPVLDSAGAPVYDDAGRPRTHPVPVMEDVEVEVEVQVPAGTRLGLRYEQCLVFEAAYLRWRVDALEARP